MKPREEPQEGVREGPAPRRLADRARRADAELHPDDLLDREARGELGDVERELLEAHLRRCVACRVERRARVDFQQETDLAGGPDPGDVQPLLAKVLAMRPASLEPAKAARISLGRRLLPLVAAAALVSAAAWAATTAWTGAWTRSRPGAAGGSPPTSVPVTRSPAPETASLLELPQAASPEGRVARADGTPPAAIAAVVGADSSPKALASPAARLASLGAHLPTEPAVLGTAFDQANSARRSGDHRHAAELYRALVERYPGTAEARASLVALGRMLLDDGDATGALRSFDRYLNAGGGALAEDAMLGRALALRQLERPNDEAQVWSGLLRQYPQSGHAERARRRLLELEGPAPNSGSGQRPSLARSELLAR